MMHAHHESLPGYDPGNVLHDGCEECEERSERVGLLSYLDDANALKLWRDMRAEKWSGGRSIGRNVSACDHRAMNTLYTIGVFMQRAGIEPQEIEARMLATANVERERLGFELLA